MSYSTYAVIMLAAGLGIPVMAALNAALGKIIGNPAGAVVMLLLVAMIAAGTICAISGSLSLTTLLAAPKHLFLAGVLAGVFAAFYMLSITYISPYFGVGNAVFFVLLGQLVSAAAIDHFALFGAHATALTPMRGLGISVMALGVWITQQA
ncbi:DMT family transporter [Paracoccaceae bacterium]|nr:DMT family transporter [Paracoccaceae bacterium]